MLLVFRGEVQSSLGYNICPYLCFDFILCHFILKSFAFSGSCHTVLERTHQRWAHSTSSTCTHLLPQPHRAIGDIFNLIKACQHYWFWHFQLWLSRLWAPQAVDLLICDEGGPISAGPHGRGASLSSLWPCAVCRRHWHMAVASVPLPSCYP